MDEVSSATLKQAFKRQVLTAHPDKGGSEAEFDQMLSAYLYLMEMTQRLSGGRTALQHVNAPDDIKESRANEARANQIINEIFEEVERDQQEEKDQSGRVKVTTAFHEAFENVHPQSNGYSEWLKEDAGDTLAYSEEGLYKEVTIQATLGSEKDLNQVFEAKMALAPKVASTSLLHPDEMAYGSCAMGVTLIEDGKGYSSFPGMNPEYCDVYAAYTSENTVLDKVQSSTVDGRPKTLEEFMAERDRVYECYQDEELEAIAEYERRRFEEEKRHKNQVTQYFSGSVRLIEKDVIEDTVENTVESKADHHGFCIQIGR